MAKLIYIARNWTMLAVALLALNSPNFLSPTPGEASGAEGSVESQRLQHSVSFSSLDTELSGLVFVLDGGILATTLPERPAPTASPGSGQASIQNGSVTASVTVLPTRTVVVDDTERIVEIWSNTGAEDGPYYALRVKQNQINGDEHPLTPSIWNQYICLLDLIDWQITDKVYP